MQVIVNELLVSYEVSGKGPTVLFLHGWGDSGKGFHQLSATVAKHFRIIVPDLPGFGGSQAPPSAWGLNEYVQLLQAFLDKVGVKSLFAVIGHSNGGAIAIRGVASENLRPERLVLLAAAGIRNPYKGRNQALRLVAKSGKLLAKPLPKAAQLRLRRKLYATVGSDMFVAEKLQETFKRVVSDDVRADAQRLNLPTLLIYGEADEQTPVSYGELFHELIADSSLEVLPGVGHFVHHERLAEVTRSIMEFLT
ncbi:MAG TPA: alpha/beta hydrolase [Candidatus Saccharimonadales bacterium]|nr:alpha/beta hydrolase [Candidatus Saccharimonadales bacterium]